MKIGERTFSAADQDAFARISADRNPLHMDAVAARRLVTGRQVVHGIHILLAAIELSRDDGRAPATVSCTFNNPVSVGDRVVFSQHDSSDGESGIEAAVDGLPCAQITLSAARAAVNDAQGGRDDFAPGKEKRDPGRLTAPLDEPAESHLDTVYTITPATAGLALRFPRACQRLGEERVGAIAALSYFVGMICPGLHSIFSSVALEVNPVGRAGPLDFVVRKLDRRVGLFEVAFRGPIDGVLKAFLRPPPQGQPSLRELSAQVAPGEFRGSRSLVIGGSRGLGECTAKILAAGGGEVTITYAAGQDDAQRICDEINGSGGACRSVKLDLVADSLDVLGTAGEIPDMVYFFATPRIYRKKAGIFDPALFRELCDFYVVRFHELCVWLEARSPGRKVRVYFPSSVFVTERPRGLAEYAMAKAAGEELVAEINRSFTNVAVTSTRLPRLNTDQTASILRLATQSNLDCLLQMVRSMRT